MQCCPHHKPFHKRTKGRCYRARIMIQMRMYTVTKQIFFAMVTALSTTKANANTCMDTTLLLSLFWPETLDHRGMVMDFSDIKLHLKSWIDDAIDHKMLLFKMTYGKVLQNEESHCFSWTRTPLRKISRPAYLKKQKVLAFRL